MLYLDAPFHTIDGIAVFGDHADRQQWYYLPGVPRIARIDGVPQLSLIKFKGRAGTGGFLNVDVDLGVDAEVVENLARQIASIENLPEPPRLAQLPVIDGSVRMLLFDAQTPAPVPAGTNPPEPVDAPAALQFVLQLNHPAKPALYGDNRAAFSVQLTQEGMTTLEAAMRGVLSPIGIVYSLDYLAMRPAYHVSVQADWNLIQKHLAEHEEFSVPLVYQSSIDRFVDSLVEKRIVEIKADTFVLEDDGSSVIARRDQAMDDIRDMITEAFFEPTLDPVDSSADVDTGVRTAGRVMQAIASVGASETCAFRRREVDVTRIENKRLDVAMSERITVKRTVFPQGHLSGLFRDLTGQGLSLDACITEVDLDDPWFERRELKVIARADWITDQVRSISVRLRYGDRIESLLLTPDHTQGSVSWSSQLENGAMVREVELDYTVHFDGVDGTERPTTLTAATRTVQGDVIEIDPRDLYAISPIPVVALNYPWDRYSAVEVELAYADPDQGIAQKDTLLLDKANPERTWPMFVRDRDRTIGRCRVIHRAVDQRDLVGEWDDIDGERIIIRDPHPNSLLVDVVPVLDWTRVKRAFVDLSYADPANGIVEEASFEFADGKDQTQQFRVRLADVTRRQVDYRVTVIGLDGSVTEVPPSVTEARRLTIRADMRGHRMIRVRPAETLDFALAKVREIAVELRYVDPANGIDVADGIPFRHSGESGTFEFDYVEPTRTSFEYRVTTIFTNNLSRTREWARSDQDDLVINPA